MPDLPRLTPHIKDLAGGLQVRRVLPAAAKRAVGPFVFFDHFGPVTLPASADTDVGPHPHIGLATVTYLFEGGFLHRDSLGTVQAIAPGAINWMTAGRGIVHSERTPPAEVGRDRRLHGLQLWVGLPAADEACEPAFQHVPAPQIPECSVPGAVVRVLVGEAFGARSPVRTAMPTLYLDIRLTGDQPVALPPGLAEELAVYSPEATLSLEGDTLAPQVMAVVDAASGVSLAGAAGSRFVVIGGDRLAPPPFIWWNFVAGRRDTLQEAAYRWETGGFEAIPGDNLGRLTMPPYPAAPPR
jgi:redox-sensitive bicupin YhaK (pirin superfamily)